MSITEITKLEDLDFNKQLAFAYLTCERLYPNYVYFSQNYNFGDPALLREAIDYLMSFITGKNNTSIDVEHLIQNVEKNTPETEDFKTIFVSAALDACTAICDSLDFLVDKDFEKIKFISSYAYDTVTMYIQWIESLDSNTNDFQKKIDSHPLMQKEILIQSGIIAYLTKSNLIDFEDLQTLLQLQENNKKSNLNI